jgi:proteic killer suppression protein
VDLIKVFIDKKAKKDMESIPYFIRDKLYQWIERVEVFGIDEARKIKGFHDEPLKGSRKGERSIRLNKSYRAIYTESIDNQSFVILIIEVHNHDY